MAEEEEEGALGEEEEEEEGEEEGEEGEEGVAADEAFANFLGRCDNDVVTRREKRLQLCDARNKIEHAECTFKPKITPRKSRPRQMEIWSSLYYRGLQQSQARLRTQRARMEEVVESEKKACTFKPIKCVHVAAKWKEDIKTPRTAEHAERPRSPRKQPLRLDIYEEFNYHGRTVQKEFRVDQKKLMDRTAFLNGSYSRCDMINEQIDQWNKRIEAGGEHPADGEDANADGEGEEAAIEDGGE